MSAELLTAIGALVVSVIVSIIMPIYIKRRSAQAELDATDLKSWQSVTGVLQKERDALQARVTKIEAEYNQKLDDMRVKHDREMAEAKERIRHLENEVADLYRKLYRTGPPA